MVSKGTEVKSCKTDCLGALSKCISDVKIRQLQKKMGKQTGYQNAACVLSIWDTVSLQEKRSCSIRNDNLQFYNSDAIST